VCTNFIPTKHTQWVKEKLRVDLPSGFPDESYSGFDEPVVVKSHQTNRVACGLTRFGLIPAHFEDRKRSSSADNQKTGLDFPASARGIARRFLESRVPS
jgi:hypothetical protein